MQNKSAHEDTFSPLPEASFFGSWAVFPPLPAPETPLAAHLAPTSRVFCAKSRWVWSGLLHYDRGDKSMSLGRINFTKTKGQLCEQLSQGERRL